MTVLTKVYRDHVVRRISRTVFIFWQLRIFHAPRGERRELPDEIVIASSHHEWTRARDKKSEKRIFSATCSRKHKLGHYAGTVNASTENASTCLQEWKRKSWNCRAANASTENLMRYISTVADAGFLQSCSDVCAVEPVIFFLSCLCQDRFSHFHTYDLHLCRFVLAFPCLCIPPCSSSFALMLAVFHSCKSYLSFPYDTIQ